MGNHDQIDLTKAAFAAALERGDATAVSSMYADCARLLPPSSAVVEGRPAIEAFWRTGIEFGISAATYEPLALHRHDGLAYELGRYALEADGGIVDRGNYLLVHEKQEDGSWRRAAEMFAPDSPPGDQHEQGEA